MLHQVEKQTIGHNSLHSRFKFNIGHVHLSHLWMCPIIMNPSFGESQETISQMSKAYLAVLYHCDYPRTPASRSVDCDHSMTQALPEATCCYWLTPSRLETTE